MTTPGGEAPGNPKITIGAGPIQVPVPGFIASAGGAIGSGVQDITGGISSTVDAAESFADALIKTGAWLSDVKNWIRIAYVTTGIVLVTVGTIMIVKNTDAGAAIGSVAKKAATAGVEVAAA